MSLSNKVAIVTGGGAGIGLSVALDLARQGARVAIWDKSPEAAQSGVAALAAEGFTAVPVLVDVTVREAVFTAAATTLDALGPVDILINNAGRMNNTPFFEITDEKWDHIMNLNARSMLLCCQAVLPGMLAAGKGRIINVTSRSGQTGGVGMVHYTASKAAVIGFTKSLALEFAAQGVTVNAVAPAFIEGDGLREDFSAERIEAMSAAAPMRRVGLADEVAAAITFLASDGASYVTGHVLNVNGGLYLG